MRHPDSFGVSSVRMRAWRIHLGWGLVAVVTAGAWGRWTVAHHEGDLGLRRISETPKAVVLPLQSRSGPMPASPVSQPASLSASKIYLLPDPYDLSLDEVRVLLKSDEFLKVLRGLEVILRLKDPALKREFLLDCVSNPHYEIRRRAMIALVPVMGDAAVPIVQSVLRSDPQTYLRREAAQLLGKLPDQGSTELLLDAYRDGEDDLKIAAAASLYRFGNPAPAAELLSRLMADLDNPDGSVRKEAVERIGTLKAPIAIPALTRALRDSSGDVRSEAASALGDIDTLEIVPLLEPLLKDPFADVRESAQDAIDSYRKRHPK